MCEFFTGDDEPLAYVKASLSSNNKGSEAFFKSSWQNLFADKLINAANKCADYILNYGSKRIRFL
jgi:hypothetical protein